MSLSGVAGVPPSCQMVGVKSYLLQHSVFREMMHASLIYLMPIKLVVVLQYDDFYLIYDWQ